MALLWGPSFLFIKIAVQEFPPLTLVAGRVGLAALLLYLLLQIQKRRLPGPGPIWKHFAVVGLFAHALPFFLFSWGEIYIDSAIASILNGTTPLFTLLIAHFAIADDRMTINKVVGALIGFAGLVLLVSPSLRGGIQTTALGLLAVTVAAASYGVAIVYAHLRLTGLPRLVAPTSQLIMATLYMVPLALIIERPSALPMPSWSAAGSLLALAVFGTAIAFVVYYRILENSGATYLSMVTYLVPVFGVILGILVLDEKLEWKAYLGCTFILLGVMAVNGLFNLSNAKLVLSKLQSNHE